MPQPLCETILSNIHRQIERTDSLMAIVSPEQLRYVPPIVGAWSTEIVLNHILDCLAGFCAVLFAVHPDQLAHFQKLREARGPKLESVPQVRESLLVYRQHIDSGFALLEDLHLSMRIPSLFSKNGELVLGLLMANLEHLVNHKHQLFMYLKLMGANITTDDLYALRIER